jgi:hypothetical protein
MMILVSGAVALAGCGGGGGSSSGVSPSAYVKSVCSAIGPFEKDVQSRQSQLNPSTIKNPTQGKQALVTFLNAVAGDTDQTVSKLKAAGTPNVNNGKAISQGIVGAFTQLKGALAQAAASAKSLPTNSPTAFRAAAEKLGTNVRTSMSSIGSSLSGLKSQQLEKAAASDATCKSLASG